jgi:hypothetical protein
MSGCSARASLPAPAVAEDEKRVRCYLLFAGSQQSPHGGLGDLVGIFTSEAMARQAFRNLRLSQTSASRWAQLAVVDGDRGPRALSWFGIGATPARTPLTFPCPDKSIYTQTEGGVMQIATHETPSPAGPEVEPAARRHLAKRIVVCLVSLAALAAITLGVVSGDGTTRPVTPNPASVGGSDPANRPVVPSSVDDSVFSDATRGAQR